MNADRRNHRSARSGAAGVSLKFAGGDEVNDAQVLGITDQFAVVFNQFRGAIPHFRERMRNLDTGIPARPVEAREVIIQAERLVLERSRHLSQRGTENDSAVIDVDLGRGGGGKLAFEKYDRFRCAHKDVSNCVQIEIQDKHEFPLLEVYFRERTYNSEANKHLDVHGEISPDGGRTWSLPDGRVVPGIGGSIRASSTGSW